MKSPTDYCEGNSKYNCYTTREQKFIEEHTFKSIRDPERKALQQGLQVGIEQSFAKTGDE